MKHKKRIDILLAGVLMLTAFSACNKEEATERVLSMDFTGANATAATLQYFIDTVEYVKAETEPSSIIDFHYIYSYPSDKKTANFVVREKESGKEVFKKTLELKDPTPKFKEQLLYVNGKPLVHTLPQADSKKNILEFYLHLPDYKEKVDISLQTYDGDKLYLAKNVQPNTWVQTEYTPDGIFTGENANNAMVFTKAGTNTGVFDDAYNPYNSWGYGSFYLPTDPTEKGLVRSYFMLKSLTEINIINMFEKPAEKQ